MSYDVLRLIYLGYRLHCFDLRCGGAFTAYRLVSAREERDLLFRLWMRSVLIDVKFLYFSGPGHGCSYDLLHWCWSKFVSEHRIGVLNLIYGHLLLLPWSCSNGQSMMVGVYGFFILFGGMSDIRSVSWSNFACCRSGQPHSWWQLLWVLVGSMCKSQ